MIIKVLNQAQIVRSLRIASIGLILPHSAYQKILPKLMGIIQIISRSFRIKKETFNWK